MENVKIFSGMSKCKLAGKVAKELGLPIGEAKIEKFKDGECYVKIDENVRGEDVFIIQSTSYPVNENIIGLLIFVDALKRASANSVTLVVPYFGYARQDRKAAPRAPITGKLIANLMMASGVDRVVTLDLHTSQLQGFFDIPVDNLNGLPIIVEVLEKNKLVGEDVVVVAPHTNAVKLARGLSETIDSKLALIDRRSYGDEKLNTLIGEVKGKKVILMDDMITTGETILSAEKLVREEGALEVYVCATHGIFSGDALERIDSSNIDRVFITDSIPLTKGREDAKIGKIEVLSSAHLFSETIDRIMSNKSLMGIAK